MGGRLGLGKFEREVGEKTVAEARSTLGKTG